MKKGNIKQIIKAIEDHDNIFIFHHIRPDGDCLGSQFGLKELIKTNYPDKKVFAIGDSKNVLSFLDFKHHNDFSKKDLQNSLAIMVDGGDAERIEKGELLIDGIFSSMARIDHHPNSANINYNFNWIDSSFVAAAEQIGYLAKKAKWKITPTAAEYIYLGINTDSGRFLYSSTSRRTFEVMVFLFKNGLNTKRVHSGLSKRRLKDIGLNTEVLSIYKTSQNVIYVHVDKKMQDKLGLTPQQSAFPNILANIDDYNIWVMFIDEENGIRVEFRSNGPKVNIVARAFGGGGHDNASGTFITDANLIPKIIESCVQLSNKYLSDDN